MPLDAELRFFNEHRAELVERYLGKFVLVKGDELIGTFDTAQNAYEAGVARFGSDSFLTKQVFREDPTATAPALFTGLTSLPA